MGAAIRFCRCRSWNIAITDWGYPFRGEVVDAGADSVPQQYPRNQGEPRGVSRCIPCTSAVQYMKVGAYFKPLFRSPTGLYRGCFLVTARLNDLLIEASWTITSALNQFRTGVREIPVRDLVRFSISEYRNTRAVQRKTRPGGRVDTQFWVVEYPQYPVQGIAQRNNVRRWQIPRGPPPAPSC